MFTGIIAALGTVAALEARGGDVRLRIRSADLDWSDVSLGDSIATNGVCLTATDVTTHGFWADVSVETLTHTTIKQWVVGTPVNLEKALTPQSRLGGHIVSGHVDGLGTVTERIADARSERWTFSAPPALARYIAQKGSITIDGTSLTVNTVTDAQCSERAGENSEVKFSVNIVPHTAEKTIINSYGVGTEVNLEVDLIARYLERLMAGEHQRPSESQAKTLSQGFLAEHGFLK